MLIGGFFLSTKLCKNCASKISMDAHICPYCGEKIDQTNKIVEEVKETEEETHDWRESIFGFQKRGPFYKWITLLLAIFLGWLGIHKFYERKFYMGLLYMVTGGFCGVGVILDIITLLVKPKVYYNYF